VAAVREVSADATAAVAALVDRLTPECVVVLATGVGVDALFAEAAKSGRAEALRARLAEATTVCRGPKPVAALKRVGIAASVRVEEPHTTKETLEALATLDVQGRAVVVLHYGERNAPLVRALAERGARVEELTTYEWRLPEDVAPLARMVEEIVARRVGAIAFTSQVQARHLLAVADAHGKRAELVAALAAPTIVAAIGPTCAAALAADGIAATVVPDHPKMGPLVAALARYVSEMGSA
jgi:uroporphyrinogen-III synthase